jgi:hypothetical protein
MTFRDLAFLSNSIFKFNTSWTSIESGPGVRMTARETAAETTAKVLKELNISPKDWRKLLDVSAADLLAVQINPSTIQCVEIREASVKSHSLYNGWYCF